MALFGRDYDNEYGRDYNRGGIFGRGGMFGSGWDRDRNRNYARDRGERWSGADDRAYYGSMRGYVGGERYDRGYQSRGYGSDYDRGYKSRWQTDHGDPYGDRTSNTPMRVIRGEYHSRGHRDRSDRGWFGRDRDRERYEADYSTNPMGYDPYRSRESSVERGWGMRDFDRGSRYGRDFREDRYF
jgi:hypothetical protein